MRGVLLLDNKDSFVWNLAQALQVFGAEVEVVRSDRVDIASLAARPPSAIVISPGPGRPEDAGVSVDVVRQLSGRMPILGVCLGHQAIGLAYGAKIARTEPRHGLCSSIRHDGSGILAGLPCPFQACRYHSLHVVELPDELLPTAWSDDGVLMALRHRRHPTFGVQFHPESFRSEQGDLLLENFWELAA